MVGSSRCDDRTPQRGVPTINFSHLGALGVLAV
jgi:hypothetical protein